MIPPVPQPDPLPLPAPGWLLWGLLVLTFFLHLIPMNLVLGGSLLGALARVRARGGQRPHDAAFAHVVVKAMPVLFSTAITMGVAALLFLQVLYGRVFFVSSILMGWWWLGVVPLLILAYYGAYLLAFREHDLGGGALVLAWLIAAIVGLVALIYGNNMTLMLRAAELPAWYATDGRGLLLNLGDRALVPRHLHMFLGAIAVTGVASAVFGVWRSRLEPEFGRWAVRHGATVCTTATALNVFAGLWWLAALPRPVLLQFMGGDASAIVILVGGILLTMSGAACLILAGAAKTSSPAPYVYGSLGTMLPGMVLMILTRDTVRHASLSVSGFEPVTWVVPQWGPIVLFVVLLIVALVSVVWMVRALARGR